MKTETEIRRGAARGAVPVPPRPRPRRPMRPAQQVRPAQQARPVRPTRATRPTVKTTKPRATGQAPRAPFVLLVVGLLCGGLVSLLLLNTVLAKDSFTANRLRTDNQQIREEAEATRNENARLSGPEALDQRARDHGMRQDRSAPEFVTPAPAR
ncbi:MAG TPA: hypothetical protein VIR33_16975 [Thermopolyspora sp.]